MGEKGIELALKSSESRSRTLSPTSLPQNELSLKKVTQEL